MLLAAKRLMAGTVTTFRRWMVTPTLIREWKQQRNIRPNERPVEYGFALECLSELCPNAVLDVGTGKTAWPRLLADCGFQTTAIDRITDYWSGGFLNRYFHVIHDDITAPRTSGPFDVVTCISVIEHIPEHEAAVQGMFKLLRPGGHVIITCPFNLNRYVDNVYKLPGAGYGRNNRYVCQVYSQAEIDGWLTRTGGRVVKAEYYNFFTGELWTFGERVFPPQKVSSNEKHHLICLLLQKPDDANDAPES